MDSANDAIFALEGNAREIWELIAEPQSAADVTDVLVAAFPDEDGETIAQDVRNLLGALAARGLVEQAAPRKPTHPGS